MSRARWLALSLALAACGGRNKGPRVVATCGDVEVLHAGVVVDRAADDEVARVACEGEVRTDADGRAVIRTDDGVELRLAAESAVQVRDGRAILLRGKAFVSSWGDEPRAVGVGDDVTVGLADTSLEVERDGRATRVIAVRGEASFRHRDQQGQIGQGESLEGADRLSVRPAGVWDDWTGGAASPRGVAHRGARSVGYAVAHVEPGEAPSPLAINLWRGAVTVRGDLALTTVEQRFFNGADRAAPVEFSLPLPPDAIVSSFALEQAGRWREARPGMIASASRGGGLAALRADRDGVLRASLGVIAPGQTLGTRITYAQWLGRDGARRRYAVPVGDPVSPQIIGEFSLDVDVSESAAAELRIPQGARLVDGHVRLRRSDWRARADLVVDVIDPTPTAGPSARGWLPARREHADRHLLVDLTLPPPASRGTDLAVVLDDSAATDPATLEVARAALDALLRQLGAQDRAALFFGDLGARAADGDAGRLLPIDDARRERILDAVARARPGGASDIGRMLVDAHGALDPRRNGVVLYLGDASPTVGTIDPARLAEEIRRQAPDLRLIALALGRDAHPEVLRPLAGEGGAVARVEDPPEAIARASELVARAMRPCLRDLRVSLGDHVHHVLPAVRDAWVSGDPLRFVGALDEGRDPPKEVRIEAREGSALRRWTVPLRTTRVLENGDLARRWASARIGQLADSGAGRASVAEIAARFGLVTPVSALLLGAEGSDERAAWTIADSPWPEDTTVGRLPSLGVGALAPRGVQALGEAPEVPVAVDDGSGWQPHRADERRGDGGAALASALMNAEPAARACVARKRALRPGLSGDISVSVTVGADGRLSDAIVSASTLGDAETESCIRRAVEGLTLPAPSLLDASPGRASCSFAFPGAEAAGAWAARSCPPSARLPRAMRRVLWRERLAAQGVGASGAILVWRNAMARCELRWWEDRVALMDLVLGVLSDPTELVRFRDALDDASAMDWLDGAIARRFGPSRAWAALHRARYVDWGALLARLADPRATADQRIALLRAWLAAVPRDMDLRLRLLTALEEAGRTREARALADALRRDRLADARVRGMVGEFLLRTGDRREALRAFTEIAEFAPYDPWARTRLGDLLLTYGEPEQAYRQYQTLALLAPGDPMPAARVGVAALAAGREDEGLRTIRRAAEVAGADAVGRVVQALLDGEVHRVAATRGGDPAVRAWVRVARQLRAGRERDVLVRWTHPDVGVELLAQRPSDTSASAVGDAPSSLGLRLFTPDVTLDGTRLVLRGAAGLQGARRAEVVLAILGSEGLVERRITLDRTRRAAAFVVRDGSLVEAPLLPGEAPPEPAELF